MSLCRDSVLFPSTAYRELCIENQEVLREEWEPRVGDWVIQKAKHVHKRPILVIGTNWQRDVVYLQGTAKLGRGVYNLIPLFQPRQLIEMIEERGRHWSVSRPAPLKGACSAVRWETEDPDEIGKVVTGPDPATALLRCLLEVMKDG